ncbi:MAG: response regulator [Euryarchaeota archaeon]|nr:response regulator [Euryarchaeota archaeon]
MTRDILIVDDSPLNLKLCQTVLEVEGYHVRLAHDAEETFSAIDQARPDLILMDIGLPGMDGLEITRRLKAREDTGDVPIVAVTGFAMKGDEERMLAAGCDGYLPKPLDIARLIAVVKDHLDGRT